MINGAWAPVHIAPDQPTPDPVKKPQQQEYTEHRGQKSPYFRTHPMKHP